MAVLTGDGKPVEGICVKLEFVMTHKNNYLYISEPSRTDGTVQLSPTQIALELSRDRNFALMDYESVSTNNASIEIDILSKTAALRALEGAKLFSRYVDYRKHFIYELEHHVNVLVRSGDSLLKIRSESLDRSILLQQVVSELYTR